MDLSRYIYINKQLFIMKKLLVFCAILAIAGIAFSQSLVYQTPDTKNNSEVSLSPNAQEVQLKDVDNVLSLIDLKNIEIKDFELLFTVDDNAVKLPMYKENQSGMQRNWTQAKSQIKSGSIVLLDNIKYKDLTTQEDKIGFISFKII